MRPTPSCGWGCTLAMRRHGDSRTQRSAAFMPSRTAGSKFMEMWLRTRIRPGSRARPAARSFFPVVIVERGGTDDSARGRAHEPFLAVGIMAGFPNRIIRDDVENQVLSAVIDELMRFVGREDECVAGFNRRRAVLVPDGAHAG